MVEKINEVIRNYVIVSDEDFEFYLVIVEVLNNYYYIMVMKLFRENIKEGMNIIWMFFL